MSKDKTHWKKLHNPDYLGAYSLLGNGDETLIVTIESVSKELVSDPTGDKKECLVARLKGQKPMILNKTNCKTIALIYGTPFIEEWVDKKIKLEVAKVRAFGDTVDALRVVKLKPELPELTPSSPRWDGAKKAISEGSVTIEQIKKQFKLTAKNEKELLGTV